MRMKIEYEQMITKASNLTASDPNMASVYAQVAIADRLDRLCKILSAKRD